MGDNFWDTVSDKKEEDSPAPDLMKPAVVERDSPLKMDQVSAAHAVEDQPSSEMKGEGQRSELETEDVDAWQESGHNQAWVNDMEGGNEIWASIGLSLAFTVALVVGVFFVTILASGTYEDLSMEDMPQAEATILEMSSYTETSCNDEGGGCSDTLYVEALLVLHCTEEEGGVWACGPQKSADSFPFYLTYDSGFFEPVPAGHMDKSEDQETHTVAYDPKDPTRVDFQPGFQFNFEWTMPVGVALLVGFGVSRGVRQRESSLKDGYANFYKLITGKLKI